MEKQWTLIIEAEPPHGSSLTTRKIAARSHNSLVVSGADCFMFCFFGWICTETLKFLQSQCHF